MVKSGVVSLLTELPILVGYCGSVTNLPWLRGGMGLTCSGYLVRPGAHLKFHWITEAEKYLKGHEPAYLLNYSDTPAATAKVDYSKASPLSGSKIYLSAIMKIFTAFTLLAILSVLAVLHFASAEEGLDQHHRVCK
nr:uncharacterized protein LOC119165086 [Rhipicephalus microplus]